MTGWFHRVAVLAVFAALASVAMDVRAGESDVLYWLVDETATVTSIDGTKTQTIQEFFAGFGDLGSDSSFAARVRVTGGDISADDDVFLGIYNVDTHTLWDGPELGIEFSEPEQGGRWGAGAVPEGNQSPIGKYSYSEGTPEYSFIVELGNVVWNSEGTEGTWTTVATSSAETYASLAKAKYMSEHWGMSPQGGAWAPTTFTVPEPSGGLLTLFGIALLALRRRRAS